MKSRAYSNRDYEAVKAFLNEVYAINKNQHSWLTARWEYAEYFVSPLYVLLGSENWVSSIRLWINDDLKIVGVVNSENPDEQAFIQIHPDYRYLEEEMIEWAENNLAVYKDDVQGKKVVMNCHDGDIYREEILKRRGYEKSEDYEHLKHQSLDRDIEEAMLPEGYSIHSFADETNLKSRIVCITRGFNPKSRATEASLDAEDLGLYSSLQSAPLYRRDLDIYTKYKDGTIASSALLWYDPVSNVGMFEPVATHPEHQRKGLGRAALLEGLRRLKALGAEKAYVGARGYRSDFYASAGFVEYDAYREWVKVIK